MPQGNSKRSSISRLKTYVALQLQAYYSGDWEVYDRLEQKIRSLEEKIIQ
ncbi:MAG: hypothetical protein G01um101431_146 [Parcubacteria group bacterium Gr01-1014_31]|nr:MAG: hypothetical protein G01um101431_146 [Parcubacteria group bacterium Gr01-1014_31]